MLSIVIAALLAQSSTDVVVMRRAIAAPRPAPITYTPTFSSTYSSCTNGRQSAPIASCRRSDGVTVANSLCGAQTTSRDCVEGCGLPQAGYWNVGSGSQIAYARGHSTPAQAQAWCNSVRPGGFTGLCLYSNDGTYVFTYLYSGGELSSGSGSPSYYAAQCQ